MSAKFKPQLSIPSPSSCSFSLLRVFPKSSLTPLIPNTSTPSFSNPTQRDHFYIQLFKEKDERWKQQMEERMKKDELPDQERKVREELSDNRIGYVRIVNGKEMPFETEKQKRRRRDKDGGIKGRCGMFEIVDINWSREKRKRDRKNKKQRENERSRRKRNDKYLSEKVKFGNGEKFNNQQEYHLESRERSRDLKKSKPKPKSKPRSRQRKPIPKPKLPLTPCDPRNIAQKLIIDTPFPNPRQSLSSYMKHQEIQEYQLLGNFVEKCNDKQEDAGLEEGRQMYGKFFGEEYVKRDRNEIRESNFDEMMKEQQYAEKLGKIEEAEERRDEQERKERKEKKKGSKMAKKSGKRD